MRLFSFFYRCARTINSIVVIPMADIFIASLLNHTSNLRRLVRGVQGPPISLPRGLKFAKKKRFRPKVARSSELIYTYKDTIRPVAGISVWEWSGVRKIVGVPLPMRWSLWRGL